MVLSARFLEDVASANIFRYTTATKWTQGDAVSVYIQLIDASLDRAEQYFNPPGRRYVPLAGATLTVTFQNIDDAKKVMKVASQPFPADDRSIWVIPILATDPISAGSVIMTLSLNESGKVTTGIIVGSIQVLSTSLVCC